MTVLWCIALAVATASLKGSDASHLAVYPMVLCAVGALISVGYEVYTGGWLSKCLWATIRAPTVPVIFKDVFIADQLLSFETIPRDAFFLGCFLGLGDSTSSEALEGDNVCIDVTGRAAPFIAMLPAFWRVMQCLRLYADSCPSAAGATGWWQKHWQRGQAEFLYNGLKYSTAFPLGVLSFSMANLDRAGQGQSATRQALSALWWLVVAVDVSFKSYWDIVHDWGMGATDNHFLCPRLLAVASSDKNNSLRSELPSATAAESSARYRSFEASHLFPIAFYYPAIAVNVALRFSAPLLASSSFLGAPSMSSVVACLEVFRRGLWNCLTLENCHVAHCHDQRVRQTQRLEHFQRSVSEASQRSRQSPLGRKVAPLSSEPPALTTTSPSDGAQSVSLEMSNVKHTNGGELALDEAPSGIKSGPSGGDGSTQRVRGGTEVWLDVSPPEKNGTAAQRNSNETANEVPPAAVFLSGEWLQGKLLEIRLKS